MAKIKPKLNKEEEEFINFLARKCAEIIINEADQNFKSNDDKLKCRDIIKNCGILREKCCC